MKWKVDFSEQAQKQFGKLDYTSKTRIAAYLKTRINIAEDPRCFGKPLVGEFAGLWRYRVGDYRLICEIQDHELLVLVLKVGHRREVYD
ncbi:MAG: type II toxin-antitoxin system RelE/ParE family toxin [Chthoniobacterales bacterium]|nr:type II toxin-antitoxin system RelE/ParE family toxin [Chthoniobacterales bacterium]